MLRDRLQRNPAEIVIVHPGDEITKNIRGHVRTKRGESLLEVFAVEGGHGGVSISQDRSLCAIWADQYNAAPAGWWNRTTDFVLASSTYTPGRRCSGSSVSA